MRRWAVNVQRKTMFLIEIPYFCTRKNNLSEVAVDSDPSHVSSSAYKAPSNSLLWSYLMPQFFIETNGVLIQGK